MKGIVYKEQINKALNNKMENSHKLSRKVIGLKNNTYEKMKSKVKKLLERL